MGPLICLVTRPGTDGRDEIGRIHACARAGVHLVQIRKPGWDALDLVRFAEAAVAAARGTAARVLVNDRADVALAAGAAGVHLRGDSAPASRVRAMAPPGFLIGRSVHDAAEAEQVARDGGVDYLLFGTVFPTSSKPRAAGAGVAALASACRAVPVPVLAIGGVTLARVREIAAAGAAGFAAIGLFADAVPESLDGIVRQARQVLP